MKKQFIFLFDITNKSMDVSSHCETYLSRILDIHHSSGQAEYGLRTEADKACFIQSYPSDEVEIEKLQWISLSSWDGKIAGKANCTNNLTDAVHSLIEDLPKFGVQLEVIWVRNNHWPDLVSNLDLFGELKCLACWHNARILLCSSFAEEDVNIAAWSKVLTAEKVPIEELNNSTDRSVPLWTGPIKMYPSESEDAVVLPGFSFLPHIPECPTFRWKVIGTENTEDEEDIFYQNHLDFLALVNIRDIPVFYITSTVYELCVKCEGSKAQKSRKFLKSLLENEQIGYIVRLTSSTSWKTKKKEQSIFRNTKTVPEEKSWMDAVIENANCPFDPLADIELDGEVNYLHFLLCKSNTSAQEQKVLAYRLRNPKDISGAASRHFAELQTSISPEVVESLLHTELPEDLATFLKSRGIPYYNTQTWLEMEDRVREAQWTVIQDWTEHLKQKGEDNCLDIRELYHIFEETRKVYTERYKELYGDYSTELSRVETLQLRPAKSETENVYSQLERMVLMYSNSLESKMARFKSSDSLAGLSPPGQVLKLNAEEFLKHFTKEGKPKKESLSTLKVKKTRMNKFDSGELKKSEWPECSHFKCHDIYYNVGSTPEKLEQKSVRLKTKLHSVETSSTCDAKQARLPQTLAMKDEVKQSKRARTSVRHSITPTKLRRTSGQLQRTPRGGRKRTLSSEEARLSLHSAKKRKLQTPPKVSPGAKSQAKSQQRRSSQGGNLEKSQEKPKAESRSQRHKRKLEAAVILALKANGVTKSENKALFKSCFQRLYLLSYSFVKDLRDYSSLTEEMDKITAMQAPTVVLFERKHHSKK